MSLRQHAVAVVSVLAFAAALALPAAAAKAADHKYVGWKKCKTCHGKELYGDQISAWKKSKHAKAYETLKTDKAREYAKKAGITEPPDKSEKCVKCHSTAFGLEPAQMKYPLKIEDGVQCESCHGPGSAYRKKKVMADQKKAVAAGLVLPKAKDCTRCHNDKSPAWDPKKYKLANGKTAGFDFEQAKKKIAHNIPKDRKGKIIELEKELRKKKKGH